MTREEAIQLRRIIEQGVSSLDDETALQGVTLFPAWKSGQAYTTGDMKAGGNGGDGYLKIIWKKAI